MTKLLASVRNLDEARIVLDAPIGILDLKEPTAGALGALSPAIIRPIVNLAQGKCAVSATVGDLPADAELLAKTIEQSINCGVDYIKLGFFDNHYLEVYPAVIKKYASQTKLVAVLFADRIAHLQGPTQLLARAGCVGVMLDTADKDGGSVTDLLDESKLKAFVQYAHQLSLLCGIAGSLEKADIPLLASIAPDYLGFRTALCEHQRRNGLVSRLALQSLLDTLANATASGKVDDTRSPKMA